MYINTVTALDRLRIDTNFHVPPLLINIKKYQSFMCWIMCAVNVLVLTSESQFLSMRKILVQTLLFYLPVVCIKVAMEQVMIIFNLISPFHKK